MNAESVKARLKNFAKESGHTFQEALTYYGLERTIYRISVSKYAEHFVLKGGILLYAIFARNYERATTDIDFLVRRMSNSGAEMLDVRVSSAGKWDPETRMWEMVGKLKEEIENQTS